MQRQNFVFANYFVFAKQTNMKFLKFLSSNTLKTQEIPGVHKHKFSFSFSFSWSFVFKYDKPKTNTLFFL